MQAASIRQSVVLGVPDGKRPHVIRRFVLECGKVLGVGTGRTGTGKVLTQGKIYRYTLPVYIRYILT